ncbi:uncharacterized protein LOC135322057 [Camelus dromedarius]|uniref:uncharacterized protein LOC135322057 n=1 Tax=Camelus dromedarius TaxID=9838 RepID=UPI00311996EE
MPFLTVGVLQGETPSGVQVALLSLRLIQVPAAGFACRGVVPGSCAKFLGIPPPSRKGAVRRASSLEGAKGNSELLRARARLSSGEAGRGRGAGPSARGAGGACDHAARGRARSAARWRWLGEQWRPRPPERRVRCRCCCGGCWCCEAAAGCASALAARAGSRVAVRPLCHPWRLTRTSVHKSSDSLAFSTMYPVSWHTHH